MDASGMICRHWAVMLGRRQPMVKDNRDFFVEKKPWSEVKDELLGCYLPAYFSKLLTSRRLVCYIDGFSGPGRFGDGKPGSPLIALEAAVKALAKAPPDNAGLSLRFVDSTWAEELRRILVDENVSGVDYKVIAVRHAQSRRKPTTHAAQQTTRARSFRVEV